MTLYDELELQPDCSFEDIKQQYRTLAMKYHPDHGGDIEKFKRIKFAYEVLSDPNRRKQYDENKTTSEPVNLRTEAIQELASIFNIIVAKFDPNQNLIILMNEEIENIRTHNQSIITQGETYIKKLETVKNKLKIKNNEDNILESFIHQQIEWKLKELDIIQKRLSIITLMIDIINNYEYGFLELINELGGNGEI